MMFRSSRFLKKISYILIFLLFSEAILAYSGPSSFAQNKTCLEPGADPATVLAINKTGTLILSDRREVRLDSILLPYPPTGLQVYESWPAWQSTLKTLEALLVGKEILLKTSERKYDRYGRLLAQVYLKEGADRSWLQKKIIEEGLARVFPYETQSQCFADLVRLEIEARAAQKGLWQHEVYHIQNSHNLVQLLQLQGSFQIVEGKVEDVVNVRGTFYINFGQNWREDFTASIAKSALRNFSEGEKTLPSYKGKRVRVRGWVELRNGPMITITYPEQIELLQSVNDQKNSESNQ